MSSGGRCIYGLTSGGRPSSAPDPRASVAAKASEASNTNQRLAKRGLEREAVASEAVANEADAAVPQFSTWRRPTSRPTMASPPSQDGMSGICESRF
mmetsp:Transcript_58407/g.162817  ORF Transcript_58407/g.162817 Transcript_58407/m.162817 type:complete len:97 (-) Transcript_58407:353-643(-)